MHKYIALTLLFSALGACGNDDPITQIDRSTDCADICNRYKDCVGTAGYDTEACTDDCSDMTSSQDTARIDDCENCLDEKSCTNSVFSCTAECAGIVP